MHSKWLPMTAVSVVSQPQAPYVHRLCITFSQSYWEQSLTAYIWAYILYRKTQKFVDRAERKVTTNPKLGQNHKSRSTEEDLLLCFDCFTATLRMGGGCMKWRYVFQWNPRKIWKSVSCYELIDYGCKQGCKTRCKCAAANFPCTALCYCGGDCNKDSIRILQPTLWVVQLHFNFISVHVMNLLSPVWTLDCDFLRVSLKHIYQHFIHPPPAVIRLQNNYKFASSVDLLLQFWPSFRFVVTFCSTRSTHFCVFL